MGTTLPSLRGMNSREWDAARTKQAIAARVRRMLEGCAPGAPIRGTGIGLVAFNMTLMRANDEAQKIGVVLEYLIDEIFNEERLRKSIEALCAHLESTGDHPIHAGDLIGQLAGEPFR